MRYMDTFHLVVGRVLRSSRIIDRIVSDGAAHESQRRQCDHSCVI